MKVMYVKTISGSQPTKHAQQQPLKMVSVASTSTGSRLVPVVRPYIAMQHPEPQPRTKWTCEECGKSLSSKRSYDEHMNIHNDCRPFACEHCDYAAASQMTLRRHKLRNHTSRRDWGYRCPYCYEAYMEPASYQQHVQSRHPGRSATFGCPYQRCSFVSKCYRFYREHLAKHSNADTLASTHIAVTGDERLQCFLVDDEYGRGNIVRQRCAVKRVLELPVAARPTVRISETPQIKPQPMRAPLIRVTTTAPPPPPPQLEPAFITEEYLEDEPPLLKPQVVVADSDWIEAEIEVASEELPSLPDGLMDVDLD